MRGTTLIYSNKKNEKNYKYDCISNENFIVYKNFNKKFEKEKIFNESEELIVIIDGVILNNNKRVYFPNDL